MLRSSSIYENYQKGGIKTPISQCIDIEDVEKKIDHFKKHKMISETIFEQLSDSNIWIDEKWEDSSLPPDDLFNKANIVQSTNIQNTPLQKDSSESLNDWLKTNNKVQLKSDYSQKETTTEKTNFLTLEEIDYRFFPEKNLSKVTPERQLSLNRKEFQGDSMSLFEKMQERKLITQIKNPFQKTEPENYSKIDYE